MFYIWPVMGSGKTVHLLILLLGLSLTNCFAQNKTANPAAVKGIIDLRQQTFKEKLPLNGQWLFYWNAFKDPNEPQPAGGENVNFPYKWTEKQAGKEKLPAFGYATYKVTLLLPPNSGQLSIDMPEAYSAYSLYVNGEKLAANGKISTSKIGYKPYWQHKIIDLPLNTDTLNITLQVANFVHSKGGIAEQIWIGQKEEVMLQKQVSDAIDLLLTGCLFMGGIFFLGLYLVGNKDKPILFFSLFSIVYSYRVFGVDNYVLHTMLPNINWYISVRLEYLTLFAGIGLFGLYTRYLYPEDTHKNIVFSISTICFSFAAFAVILPPYYFTQLLEPFLLVTIFCIFYVLYVYTRAYKQKRPGAIYTLMSSFALMATFSISLLHYWGMIPPFKLVSFSCYIAFFFLQSMILSHRVYFNLKRARREAEQGLLVKSEFLSTMSHEIRTPLNAVIGMSHLLLNNPREDQVEQLDVMLFSANNLLAIVNDILDYNKIEAGKVSFEQIDMDIAAIARNVVAGLQTSASDKNIDLRLNVDEALKNKVIGDPTRTTQVITNLVHNAIKFTNTGYVALCIAIEAQTETSITLNIRVKDTGIGISKEKQKLIFERFTQADSSTSRAFGGSGLGLAITKRILELQNASLSVDSEEGSGSTFYFMQTFAKSIHAAGEKRPVQLPVKDDKMLAGIQILLVEDNLMNVLVAKRFLEQWGAIIDVAENGLIALEMLDISRHSLVLMDLHMPVMDGYESSKKMRAAGITIPILAFTANLPEEIRHLIEEAGIDDLIVKPFLPDELYSKVLHYI
jgi:signal transduction histidine kinase/CheY-like chemotaxis protein